MKNLTRHTTNLRYRCCLWLLCLAAFTPVTALAQAGDIQRLQFPLVDHPVYRYLDRAETAGCIPLLSASRPYLGLAHHPAKLNCLDSDRAVRRETERYRSEGAAMTDLAEVQSDEPLPSCWRTLARRLPLGIGTLNWLYPDGFHFAKWHYDSTFSVSLQPVYGLELFNTDDARGKIQRFTSGLRLEGGYGQHVRYMVDFRDHTDGQRPLWDGSGQLTGASL